MTTTQDRARYQPTPSREMTARENDGRWTLVFVREFAHPPESVWAALTEPEELGEWAPFDAPRSLAVLGPVTLVMAGGDGTEQSPAEVTIAEAPRLLEYTWEQDRLRWELAPTPGGTRLTLSHTVSDRSWLAKVAAGWHICLDVMDRALGVTPIGRIVAGEATQFGWPALNAEYARRFGVDP